MGYFSFQPVIHDWCNKSRGMCYPVSGMVHIKEPLLLWLGMWVCIMCVNGCVGMYNVCVTERVGMYNVCVTECVGMYNVCEWAGLGVSVCIMCV